MNTWSGCWGSSKSGSLPVSSSYYGESVVKDYAESSKGTWANFSMPYPKPLNYVRTPYKEEGTRPHIIISDRQAVNPLKVLDVYSKVFGISDRTLLTTKDEMRPKINLSLKKPVTKRIEYNVMTGGSGYIKMGDPLVISLDGQVEPWTTNLDNNRIIGTAQ